MGARNDLDGHAVDLRHSLGDRDRVVVSHLLVGERLRRVLCTPAAMATTHPHELRGFLMIAVAVAWGLLTIGVARGLRPARP
jgi:hypothetical protein